MKLLIIMLIFFYAHCNAMDLDFDSRRAKEQLLSDGKLFTSALLAGNHLELGRPVLAELTYNFACAYRATLKNDAEAFTCMKASAELGYLPAQHDLAVMLEKGIGCNPNLKESVYWYQNSADRNYAASENVLGSMYELGNAEIQPDESKALDFYKRAAEHGLVLGLKNLERLLDASDGED